MEEQDSSVIVQSEQLPAHANGFTKAKKTRLQYLVAFRQLGRIDLHSSNHPLPYTQSLFTQGKDKREGFALVTDCMPDPIRTSSKKTPIVLESSIYLQNEPLNWYLAVQDCPANTFQGCMVDSMCGLHYCWADFSSLDCGNPSAAGRTSCPELSFTTSEACQLQQPWVSGMYLWSLILRLCQILSQDLQPGYPGQGLFVRTRIISYFCKGADIDIQLQGPRKTKEI